LNQTAFTVEGSDQKWRAVDGTIDERVFQAPHGIQIYTRYPRAENGSVVTVSPRGDRSSCPCQVGT
jgi:hypothetical protein